MSATGGQGCAQIQEWCSESLDTELDAARTAAVDAHLAVCAACRQYMATLRKNFELCRNTPRPCVDEDCFRRAVDAARQELLRRGLLGR